MQDLKEIKQELRLCFGADAARMLHQFSRKRRHKSGFDFSGKIKKSRELLDWRRDNVPEIVYPDDLPIVEARDKIKAAVASNQVVIIAGETGSGKTTQLPKICLELGRGISGYIGCTQPRRVAAVSISSRVAEELGSRQGEAVGYQVRFDEKVSHKSYVKFMTDGILLAETRVDPDLLAYDTLIIDEAHERSLNIDFILGYLKRLLPRRPDLKVIVSSATLEVERFVEYFSGAESIIVEGRTYPVDVIYQPIENENALLSVQVGRAYESLISEFGNGDALVFMSGEQEIRETVNHLERRRLVGVEVLPLYGRLTPAEQQRVFAPGAQRRIIVATNVAETSVTVPRIRYVIDAGQARIKRFNSRTGVESLQVESISKASAAQRCGRCGRIGPGICVRLYSEDDFESREEYTDPEIKRSSLAGVILHMNLLRLGKVEDFPFIQPPPGSLVRAGYSELEEIGAISEAGEITAEGKRIARLPIEPRFGKMLLTALEYGCLDKMLTIVSGLSVQDPRLRPVDKQEDADRAHGRYRDRFSDFLSWLHLWRVLQQEREKAGSNNKFNRFCRDNFLSYLRLREWFNTRAQLEQELSKYGHARSEPRYIEKKKLGVNDIPEENLHRALLSGLLSHCGKYHDEDKEYRGAKETRYLIWPGSGLSGEKPEWTVAAEIVETSKKFARTVAKIKPEWLEDAALHLLKRSYSEPFFDEKSGCVRAFMNATLYGLPVVEKRRVHYGSIDPEKSREIFIRDGLVGMKLRSRVRFYKANVRLINSVQEEQDRIRSKELLVDTNALYDFYDKRLPKNIYTEKNLQKYARREEERGRKALFMCEQDILLENRAGLSKDLFPDKFKVGDFEFPLTYKFDPSAADDGVSCTIPLGVLPNLNPEEFEWLVPGLWGEKIAGMLRSLPRSLRREFNPIPDSVELLRGKFLRRGSGFTTTLCDLIRAEYGVKLGPEDFRPEELTAFLRMNFIIIDSSSKVVVSGRDLPAIQQECAGKSRSNFEAASKDRYEKKSVCSWDFELFSPLRLAGGAVGYLGLKDNVKTVSLEVFPAVEPALRTSRRGIARLALNILNVQCRRIIKSLPVTERGYIYYAAIGGGKERLQQDILLAAVLYLLGREKKLPDNKAEFESFCETLRSKLYEVSYTLGGAVQEALLAVVDFMREIEALKPSGMKREALEEIYAQVSRMVYNGFVRDAGVEYTPAITRYIAGLQLRVKKLEGAVQKDRKRAQEINPLWQRCLEAFSKIQQAGGYSESLIEYRWMLEEYAVSLFAQEVGTACKISLKRLDEIWRLVLQDLGQL